MDSTKYWDGVSSIKTFSIYYLAILVLSIDIAFPSPCTFTTLTPPHNLLHLPKFLSRRADLLHFSIPLTLRRFSDLLAGNLYFAVSFGSPRFLVCFSCDYFTSRFEVNSAIEHRKFRSPKCSGNLEFRCVIAFIFCVCVLLCRNDWSSLFMDWDNQTGTSEFNGVGPFSNTVCL